jgi:3-oxoacyl-[acyl-carrier-protein] synthase-1
MNRTAFLGAGIATHLGTGVAQNLAGLHQPPPPEYLERRADDRRIRIPFKPLRDFASEATEQRLSRVIDVVVEEALTEAALTASERRRMALCVGSSSFDIGVSENLYIEELTRGGDVVPLRSSSFGNLAERVRFRFGLQGEDYSFNTACTASANGLGYAARLIRSGSVEHALVLGVELQNDLTALGFFGLELLSRSEMTPFDARRDGFVLGESCSAVVLGPGDSDRFRWRGDGNLCDPTSMVASQSDGLTIAAVIERALADAGAEPSSISAVKAHGTASLSNDEAEAAGLLRVFAALPPVCAIKPYIGHSLGACGLTELVLFYRAIESGFLIATPGIGADSAPLGLALNQAERAITHGCFLLNSFGFGGNNTAVVISRG